MDRTADIYLCAIYEISAQSTDISAVRYTNLNGIVHCAVVTLMRKRHNIECSISVNEEYFLIIGQLLSFC